MPITQAVPHSYKIELLSGIHDFSADTFHIALYDGTVATLDHTTTTYTSTGEVTSLGYTAGGNVLTKVVGYPAIVSGAGAMRFEDSVWAGVTFGADGALIYNATKGNRAVLVLAFPSRQTPSSGVFTMKFPITLPPIVQVA